MAKPLIQFLSETSGACCQWQFLQQFNGLTLKATAKKLGVSERTISEARSMVANGALRCRRAKGCACDKKKES